MGLGLAVVVAGLILLPWLTAAGQAILAVGMGIYLIGIAVTVVGITLVYREVPPPRPNFIWLRWSLLYDAVHARSANAEHVPEGTGSLDEPNAEPSHVERLRQSTHWRPAVWALRMMGPAVAVVLAGLILLPWSTAAGHTILAVGIGSYILGIVLSFVEVNRAYGEMQPPRSSYARAHQQLWHDALHARS